MYTIYCTSILHSPAKAWLIDDDGTKQRHKLSQGLAGCNTFAVFLAPLETTESYRIYFKLPDPTGTSLQINLANLLGGFCVFGGNAVLLFQKCPPKEGNLVKALNDCKLEDMKS